MTKALLIDYTYCTGCHTCEVACQVEHGFPTEKLGMVVQQIGPYPLNQSEKKWQYDFFVTPTAFCNGCIKRVAKGKRPSCVQHCQTACIEFGELADLAQKAEGAKKAIFTI